MLSAMQTAELEVLHRVKFKVVSVGCRYAILLLVNIGKSIAPHSLIILALVHVARDDSEEEPIKDSMCSMCAARKNLGRHSACFYFIKKSIIRYYK